MRFCRIVCVAALLSACVCPLQAARAQEGGSGQTQEKHEYYTIQDIEVVESKPVGPIVEDKSEPASVSTLPRQTIETFGGPAQVNPYTVLNKLMPSVNSESMDAYGLVNESNLRIRGQSAFTFGSLSQTVNGAPIGISTGYGASGNYIDLENINTMSLYRGPIPADKGFGFGDAAGVLDMQVLGPSYTRGATIEQKLGTYNFNRTYGRLDSGELATGTRVFGSFSHALADKWRGTGDAERLNFMGGLAQPFFDNRLNLEVYALYNKFNQDEYRPLSYAQTRSQSFYRGFDFTGEMTGDPSVDYAYYGYNRQYFDEWSVFGKLEAKLWQGATASFRPYYAGNDGRRYNTAANSAKATGGGYTYTVMDYEQRQFGYLAQIEQKLDPVTVKLGYWYQNLALYPPVPASVRTFKLLDYGSYFGSWSNLAEVGDRVFHSPYLQTKADLGKVHLSAGLRYLSVDFPSVTAYNTAGVPDGSYDDVLDTLLTPNANLSAKKAAKDVWLPNAGISYDLTDQLSARFMYGRTYACPPQGPFYNGYSKYLTKFQAAGITFQSLWDDMKLETADNFDVGLRFANDTFSLSPTFYYSRHYNKQVTVYDNLVGGSYSQTNAEAESIGGELEASWKATSWLTLFGAGSYNRFTFTKNLNTALNTTLNIKGNQVPDVPLWQAKFGLTAKYEKLAVTPTYRYMDLRYGDVQNKQSLNGYHIVDLSMAYDIPNVLGSKKVTLTLDLQNILDQRYIAVIRSSDDSTADSSIYYYPGAPFNAVAGIRLEF
ncbi:TonB-dependent receptor [Solidesulfovibrio sp.]|uniref:TonB-dependent receptor n=1 Tax=Solidesulfovibrio sp. TaxID=2910990 RepID=UPI002B220CEF|nr:TonB-dependent receptor [Solidesulfovibrio sp.]MEA5088255.1 TonB-dependent receptor [Solidesulfovibrio sp.]